MSPAKPVPGTAHEWLVRARAKFALAQTPLPQGGLLEDLCYMAQQSAELAIKAIYIHRGLTFQYTHDLDQLLCGLTAHGLTIPSEADAADELSNYAVETRYPGLSEPVTQPEYDNAVRIAAAVIEWAQRLLLEPTQ